jgi:osmotically-inducible protein OsmY
VRDGCVKLEGTVPVRSMRYDIENIAAETLGVTDVENNLSVPRRQPDQDADPGG